MSPEQLVSTAVMGAVVVAVTLWVTLSPRWNGVPVRTTLAGDDGDRREFGASDLLGQPAVWTVAFALVVVVVVVVIVGFDTAAIGGVVSPTIALIGGMGLLLVAFLLYGIYDAAASRGHPKSLAAGEAATVAAVLFLVAAVAQLFL